MKPLTTVALGLAATWDLEETMQGARCGQPTVREAGVSVHSSPVLALCCEPSRDSQAFTA